MEYTKGGLVALVLAAAVGACQSTGTGAWSAAGEDEQVHAISPSAVLEESALDELAPLLDVMTRNIPSMRVRSTSACPAVSLRGPNTAPGITEPAVYVDGVRMMDTCILSSLNAIDVRRVEIYANGVTGRPGYAVNAHGLILIFMRRN